LARIWLAQQPNGIIADHNWLRVHIIGMGVSYTVLLTAFYVDNGPHLPLWRQLPTVAYWIAPGLFGLPIMVFTHSCAIRL